MLQAEPQTVADFIEMEAPAVHSAAPAPEVAPAGAAPRRPILEALLEAHPSGESRWPLAGRILDAVEGGPRPLTRAEVVAEVTEPGVDRVIGMLLARGVLVERPVGKKAVLVPRPRGAA